MTTDLLRSEANAIALARARGALAAHERPYRALEAHAMRCHADGEPLAAAAWAQIACHAGWARPFGQLGAPRLEALLNELGRTHVATRAAGAPARAGAAGSGSGSGSGPRSVLHVMTESYPVGGHTQVVRRWIERDERRSTVVLTGQRGGPAPALVASAAAVGAPLIDGLAGADLFERAAALRALAAEHELVVIHAHMHDVLPSLAFAEPEGRPPTIHFDHASHRLWIGVAAADVLASLREIEVEIAASRRGFPHERIHVLPIPTAPRTLPARDAARAQLGLDPEVPVILAVASAWKVRPALEPTFATLLGDALAAAPGAVCLLVGPRPGPDWAEAVGRSNGRLQVLGEVPDIGPLLAAADVLLDSWPVTGHTTILDAGSACLPIVSLGRGSADYMLRPMDDVLEPGIVHAGTSPDAARAVAELLADAPRRTRMGTALREAIDRRHGAGWPAHLKSLVATACRHAGAAAVPPEVAAGAPSSWECALELTGGADRALTPLAAAADHVGDLPAHLRPADGPALGATVEAILAADAAPIRRAIVQPQLDAGAVRQAVDELRRLLASGAVDACTVVIAPDRLADGVRLLQAALDAGEDIDIDIHAAATLDGLAGDDDLVLDAAVHAQPLQGAQRLPMT